MKILLLTSAYNSMCQNIQVELEQHGHEVAVELAVNSLAMHEAVANFEPELVVCPMLTIKIPEDIWSKLLCLIVHPGIKGDRGPSSIDWALLDQKQLWGVTILEASHVWDGGDIWYTSNFELRQATKSSIYRNEIVRHAVAGVIECIKRKQSALFQPEKLDYRHRDVLGTWLPYLEQGFRQIEWALDTTESIVRKIRSSDSSPGVLDAILGHDYFIYGVCEEKGMRGRPGEIIAKRNGAICRATIDGAIWISHLKRRAKDAFKLPATMILGQDLADVAEIPYDPIQNHATQTYRDIWYEEVGKVGYLHFEFYNGAMSTEHCIRLKEAYLAAIRRDTYVIVLMGGADYWSNGIHLNVIEAASDPASESWCNINAIDDFVESVITTDSHITISAMQGSAGAGGVMMALASDHILVNEGVVLNPHYKSMGGLYGSEYWTYLLPKRIGPAKAMELTELCQPIHVSEAQRIGLVDRVLKRRPKQTFCDQVRAIAEAMADSPFLEASLDRKRALRQKDEATKPLAQYRQEELEQMKYNFFGEESLYHEARRNFVLKVKAKETPTHLKKDWQDLVKAKVARATIEPSQVQFERDPDANREFLVN